MSTLVKVAMATPIMAPMTRPLRGAAVLLFECVLMGGHCGSFLVVVWESQASPNTAAPLNGLAIGAIIGAVMATFTGVFMFLIEFFLFADHISLAA